MRITVAVCTWNRARLLDQTLAAMRQLQVPAGVEWELLVVNNNCTDATDDVIERHSTHLPIRRIFEVKQGHCHSRNRAVAEAAGDLILWTDDDVLVDPKWLFSYVTAAREWPQASFFGGRVDPWFEADPPRWILRHLGVLQGPYAIRQLGEEVRPFGLEEGPFGANMAFRTAVLKGMSFDVRLGKAGTSSVVGDETEMFQRLRERGHQGVWVGAARVRHFIPVDRLTEKYLREWYCGKARTDIRMEGMPECRSLGTIPLWALRQYWEGRLKSLCLSPFKGPRWLSELTRAAYAQGVIEEARGQRHR